MQCKLAENLNAEIIFQGEIGMLTLDSTVQRQVEGACGTQPNQQLTENNFSTTITPKDIWSTGITRTTSFGNRKRKKYFEIAVILKVTKQSSDSEVKQEEIEPGSFEMKS